MKLNKCIVIPDSFKGTMSSSDICAMAREAIGTFFPGCQVDAIPVADGGEGTAECFLQAIAGGERVTAAVTGPWGEPVEAAYARFRDRAVIEMAAAAGLPLAGERRDPSRTTTYGVGQLIAHAIRSGCREILLGLGGSATNDGGCGCAAALGVEFRDQAGRSFVPVGGTLEQIACIRTAPAQKLLEGVTVTLMSDVENPLCGVEGAAHVFAPQKGADQAMVLELDRQLEALEGAIGRELGLEVGRIPGAGAAGGMGAGCVAFLGAGIKSGIEAVLDMVAFDHRLEGADLVLTGEGRIDGQSVRGKVISGIARRTKPRGVPLVALVGDVADDAYAAYDLGVTAIFSINRQAIPFSEARGRSRQDYRRTLEDLLRLLQIS